MSTLDVMNMIKCTRISPSLVEQGTQAADGLLISFMLIQFSELSGMKPLSYHAVL